MVAYLCQRLLSVYKLKFNDLISIPSSKQSTRKWRWIARNRGKKKKKKRLLWKLTKHQSNCVSVHWQESSFCQFLKAHMWFLWPYQQGCKCLILDSLFLLGLQFTNWHGMSQQDQAMGQIYKIAKDQANPTSEKNKLRVTTFLSAFPLALSYLFEKTLFTNIILCILLNFILNKTVFHGCRCNDASLK